MMRFIKKILGNSKKQKMPIDLSVSYTYNNRVNSIHNIKYILYILQKSKNIIQHQFKL